MTTCDNTSVGILQSMRGGGGGGRFGAPRGPGAGLAGGCRPQSVIPLA